MKILKIINIFYLQVKSSHFKLFNVRNVDLQKSNKLKVNNNNNIVKNVYSYKYNNNLHIQE